MKVDSCKDNKIYFAANPKKINWRIKHGIPVNVTSEYIGYTGPKVFKFPTEANLSKEQYPDITSEYDKLLKTIIKTTNSDLGKIKPLNFIKKCIKLGKNFKCADPWDTKFLGKFPGRTKDGKVQYAMLKGEVVSANYVSNMIYGEALSQLGFKKWFSKMAAKLDSCGISNLIFQRQIPTLKNLKFRDTKFDQDVIEQAFQKHL